MGLYKNINELKKELNNPNKTIAMSQETFKKLDQSRGLKANIIIVDEIPFEDTLSVDTNLIKEE